MVFNTLLPVDSDPAMDIDIYIRDLKESVAERLQCTNSVGVDEHQDGDEMGLHEPSLVSFVQIFDTVLEYENASKISDGLYYVRATELLYSSTGPLTTSDHASLLGRSEVDEHDFYHVGDDSREHQVNLTLEAASSFSQSDANTTPPNYGVLDTSPLPSAHATSNWVDAHGAGTFDITWITARNLNQIPTTADNDGAGKRFRVQNPDPAIVMNDNDFYFVPTLRIRHNSPGGGGNISYRGTGATLRLNCRSMSVGEANDFRVYRLSRHWNSGI